MSRPGKLELSLALVVSVAVAACGSGDQIELEEASVSLEISSTAFVEGDTIPTRFTCDGDDVSPPLTWTGTPSESRSIALIADDPDAPRGTWVHWVLYGLPPKAAGLPEAVPGREELDTGARHGKNDFGRSDYGGPCPPRGSPHRYFFKVYALDVEITLGSGATKQALSEAMQGHILAQGELMGRYQRE